jgi:ribosomal protein S18 acetylase RimI-like enzyme
LSANFSITQNRASINDLEAHLTECNASFMPPLSERVHISHYVQQLHKHAHRFEGWAADNRLAGLVAAYINDETAREAYITSVSVVREWQGLGLGKMLLDKCIEFSKSRDFLSIKLKVHSDNATAIAIYRQQAFELTHRQDHTLTMARRLN